MSDSDFLNRHEPSVQPPTRLVARLIGASCGAFVFCFIAILISAPQMLKIGQNSATLVWLFAAGCGAVGGFAFPRIGQFMAYGFFIFMNVMLSLSIGRNGQEQLSLFVLFALIELMFILIRRIMRSGIV